MARQQTGCVTEARRAHHEKAPDRTIRPRRMRTSDIPGLIAFLASWHAQGWRVSTTSSRYRSDSTRRQLASRVQDGHVHAVVAVSPCTSSIAGEQRLAAAPITVQLQYSAPKSLPVATTLLLRSLS
jgi:hypothetical protein